MVLGNSQPVRTPVRTCHCSSSSLQLPWLIRHLEFCRASLKISIVVTTYFCVKSEKAAFLPSKTGVFLHFSLVLLKIFLTLQTKRVWFPKSPASVHSPCTVQFGPRPSGLARPAGRLVFLRFAHENSATNACLFAQMLCSHLDSCGLEMTQMKFEADNGRAFIGCFFR